MGVKDTRQITYYLDKDYFPIFEALSVRMGSGRAVIDHVLLPFLDKERRKAEKKKQEGSSEEDFE